MKTSEIYGWTQVSTIKLLRPVRKCPENKQQEKVPEQIQRIKGNHVNSLGERDRWEG